MRTLQSPLIKFFGLKLPNKWVSLLIDIACVAYLGTNAGTIIN